MRRIFTSVAPTIVTGVAGAFVLVSFLVPSLIVLRAPLIGVAAIIAGVAVMMGFAHLLYVHIRRLRSGTGAIYSLMLILSASAALVILLIDRYTTQQLFTHFIFQHIIVSTQTAFGALLAVFLMLAALRMLMRRRGAVAAWFLVAGLVVLVTQVPVVVDGPVGSVLTAVRQVFDAIATAGMRGLLLGVALGTLATAFRVLFFIDRPQSE